VKLAIQERPTPFGVDQYTWLSSNELPSNLLIQLKKFTPPSESSVGPMTVLCNSIKEFRYLTTLLDGTHEAVLRSPTGFVAGVRLAAENAVSEDQFPGLITLRVQYDLQPFN
jgi:hypothetical protein